MSEQTITTTPPAAPAPPEAAPPAEVTTQAPPARASVGSLVRFNTTDSVTGLPLQGLGIVAGHVEDVDRDGTPTGPLRARVVPLPADYLLLGDDELVTER